MGNCLKRPSTFPVDDEDDWDVNKMQGGDQETKMRLLEPAGAKTDQLKIKVTKKQLEELMGRADKVGLSTDELLIELLKGNVGESELRHRPWRPALQSIPE